MEGRRLGLEQDGRGTGEEKEALVKDLDVLVVDDNPEILDVMPEYISGLGYAARGVSSAREALEALAASRFDLVISDLVMPEMGGLELLGSIKEQWPETEVVILTGYGTVGSAVSALRLGAYDYLEKPIEIERLKRLLEHLSEKKSLRSENLSIRRQLSEGYKYHNIVGVNPAMRGIFELIERIAGNDATVLIQGESGTGKELVARTIHEVSRRREAPFVAINCGAVVESLLESELFGYEKGAFTGAVRDKIGLFQAADEGTIFLDEIAEMSPALQVKLLRALQEKRVRPVGGVEEHELNARIIAATNTDVETALRNETLRRDLYYRLNVVRIDIPPLRDRLEDIPVLVRHFISRFNRAFDRNVKGVSPDALECLLRYPWPGNVRELENALERAFALGQEDHIGVTDLPPHIHQGGQPGSPLSPRTYNLRENEIHLIRQALKEAGGNKNEAARLLGVDVSTVYRKIQKYRLEGDASHHAIEASQSAK